MDPLILTVIIAGLLAAAITLAGITTTLLETRTGCQCRDCSGWAWYAARMRTTPAAPSARRAVYTGLRRAVAR